MLFLVALCAVYRLEQWKQLVILVTAFTVGHSITLGLTSLSLLTIPSDLIEFLIPVTISITALHNVSSHRQPMHSEKLTGRYLMALILALFMGWVFLTTFAFADGRIFHPVPLFGFNLGIELGQLLVVFFIVGTVFIFLNLFGMRHRDWNVFISGGAFSLSLTLMYKQVLVNQGLKLLATLRNARTR